MAVDEITIGRKQAEATKLRGVYYDQRIDKFVARSRTGGKATIHATCETAAEAAAAYAQAKPLSKRAAKLQKQADGRPRSPSSSGTSTMPGMTLWSFVPECLRPRLMTEGLWGARVWAEVELAVISVWLEQNFVWAALGKASGAKPAAPRPNGHDYEGLAVAAAERPWPRAVLPRALGEAKELSWRGQRRVEAWAAHITASGLAQGTFEDVLATTLPDEAESALTALIYEPRAPRPERPIQPPYAAQPIRPKGLGFIPAERSGLTSAQHVELMARMGMDHVAFSAYVNELVRETGKTFGPIVRELWEAQELVA